jgi:hypothetical protein
LHLHLQHHLLFFHSGPSDHILCGIVDPLTEFWVVVELVNWLLLEHPLEDLHRAALESQEISIEQVLVLHMYLQLVSGYVTPQVYVIVSEACVAVGIKAVLIGYVILVRLVSI